MTPTEADIDRSCPHSLPPCRHCIQKWLSHADSRVTAAEAGIAALEGIVAAWESSNGDLVRRVKGLEAENAKLRKVEADYNADMEEELMRLALVENELEACIALVHSRLDAMGVPACETETCQWCDAGDDCLKCDNTRQRPVACRLTARLDWLAERLKKPTLTLKDVGEIPPLPYPTEARAKP